MIDEGYKKMIAHYLYGNCTLTELIEAIILKERFFNIKKEPVK